MSDKTLSVERVNEDAFSSVPLEEMQGKIVFNTPGVSWKVSLERVIDWSHKAITPMIHFSFLLDSHPLLAVPPRSQNELKWISRELKRQADVLTQEGLQKLGELSRVFSAEIRLLQERNQPTRYLNKALTRNIAWAEENIQRLHSGFLASIRRHDYWADRFLKQPPNVFPAIAALPFLAPVWSDFQYHNIGAAWVPLRKEKFWWYLNGIPTVNMGFAHFPHLPEWNPDPVILIGTPPEKSNDRMVTAVDPMGPIIGLPVLPELSNIAPVYMNGYVKYIYVTGVPKECSIEFASIMIKPRFYYRPSGQNTHWIDLMAQQGKPASGISRPDGISASHNVGNGTWVFSDFPNSGFPPNTPACAYIVSNFSFRTWIREICPGKDPVILGYYEWGFRQVQHKTNAGTESISTAPGNGPNGVPAPPGDWPSAPGSGPTQWTGAENVPEDTLNQLKTMFGW